MFRPAAPTAPTTTMYGAQWGHPTQTGAVLRATASNYYYELRPASLEHVAAAVIGTEAWMLSFPRATITTCSAYGHRASRAVTNLLGRVAGHRRITALPSAPLLPSGPLRWPQEWQYRATWWDIWLDQYTIDPRPVYRHVIDDLSVQHPQLDAMVSMLAATAY